MTTTIMPANARRLLHLLLLGVLLLLAPAAQAASQQPAILFRNVRVFDGERTLEQHDVLARNGTIERVGRGLSAPAGAQTIDATGKTLLPGFIDAHTHTFGDVLREAAVFGVTTQLDMFTDHRFAATLRAEQAAGKATGRADLLSAGTLITAPRGHGTQFGMPIPTITSPDSAQAFVDARIAEGSDWIKVVLDDGHAYGLQFATIDEATLRAVVQAAHRRSRLAVVHVGDAASARTAIEAGADGLVHSFADQAPPAGFALLVKSRGAFVIPTLTVVMSIAGTGGGAPLVSDSLLSPLLSTASRQNLEAAFPQRPNAPKNVYDFARETVRQLHAQGVRILAGTDAPNPGTWYGAAMHRELELLVEAGLTPTQALAAATSVPADAFRLTDRGRIAAGKRADLLLVEGDPTRDILATRRIAGVWKSGVELDRASFARSVAAARAAEGRGPAVPADGMLSDFESGMTAAVGSWMPSADAFAGGTSTGEVLVLDGGAGGSRQALTIRGTITATVPFAWYGAMWSPGAQPMSPVDLSGRSGFSFRTQGDGKTYRVMVFSRARGTTPVQKTFTAGSEWSEVTVSWSDLGLDGSDIMGILIGGGPQPGAFALRIDDFRLR